MVVLGGGGCENDGTAGKVWARRCREAVKLGLGSKSMARVVGIAPESQKLWTSGPTSEWAGDAG